jgi:hypothetical protein
MTHLVPLAKEVDDDKVTPGVLGFIVFAVMALAVWVLMKSMNRHMGKVDFKEPEKDRTDVDEPGGAARRGGSSTKKSGDSGK